MANSRLMQANEFNPDLNAGVVVASATLLALYGQRTRGIGQHIRVSMLGANAYANADDFLSYEGKSSRAMPDGELYGLSALHRLYRAGGTREDGGGWVFLTCPTESEWRALISVADFGAIADDSRFADVERRHSHDTELSSMLTTIFATRSADEWEQLLTAHDVACVRADGGAPGLFWESDPHVRETDLTVEASHPRWGSYRRYASLLHLSRTTERLSGGVLGGQHGRELLTELGWEEAAVDDLLARGVISELDH